MNYAHSDSSFSLKEHRLLWALILSLLLHLIFLLLYSKWGEIEILKLPDSVNKKSEKQIAFEIVETPEESRSKIPPKKAQLLSDKNALAKDLVKKDMGTENLPYSKGVADAKVFPEAKKSGSDKNYFGKTLLSGEKSHQNLKGFIPQAQSRGENTEFSRELLLGGKKVPPKNSLYDQRQSSAKDIGGISFNTYAWDFAPYLLELKRRIERNIYPPPAFTYLGFGGKNVIRFRIALDGSLDNLQVLEYEGEKALVRTSQKAVEMSAPFRPLPEDFPEKYLEVTATFSYIITSKY